LARFFFVFSGIGAVESDCKITNLCRLRLKSNTCTKQARVHSTKEQRRHQAKMPCGKRLTVGENFETSKKRRIFVIYHKKSRAFPI
jgi:hypothetical protein